MLSPVGPPLTLQLCRPTTKQLLLPVCDLHQAGAPPLTSSPFEADFKGAYAASSATLIALCQLPSLLLCIRSKCTHHVRLQASFLVVSLSHEARAARSSHLCCPNTTPFFFQSFPWSDLISRSAVVWEKHWGWKESIPNESTPISLTREAWPHGEEGKRLRHKEAWLRQTDNASTFGWRDRYLSMEDGNLTFECVWLVGWMSRRERKYSTKIYEDICPC